MLMKNNIKVIYRKQVFTLSTSNKKTLLLQGLCCANCAIKIEEEVKKIQGVSEVNMNFATSTLSIESDNQANFEDILNKTKKIVNHHEPNIIVKEKIISISNEKTKINDFRINKIDICVINFIF